MAVTERLCVRHRDLPIADRRGCYCFGHARTIRQKTYAPGGLVLPWGGNSANAMPRDLWRFDAAAVQRTGAEAIKKAAPGEPRAARYLRTRWQYCFVVLFDPFEFAHLAACSVIRSRTHSWYRATFGVTPRSVPSASAASLEIRRSAFASRRLPRLRLSRPPPPTLVEARTSFSRAALSTSELVGA